jgi:hypothetical protein
MRHLLIATLIGLSVMPGMASEEAALSKAGVLGTWAIDCSKPPATSNYHMVYAVDSKGVATETQLTGSQSVRQLRNVQLISKQWLLYSYLDADGEMLSILTFFDGGRKKSWWSVGKDGAAYIMDGKFLPGGNSVPWFEKCK